MSIEATVGLGAGTFLLSLGGAMWWQAGPAVFTAITEFGLILCH